MAKDNKVVRQPRDTTLEDALKQGEKEVKSDFKSKTIKITTPRGKAAKEVALQTLIFPFYVLKKAYKEARRGLVAGTELTKIKVKFQPKIKRTVEILKGYINEMTQKTGWITAEVLAKMTESLNQKVSILADLLAKGGNKDVVTALQASLGLQSKHGSVSEAVSASIPILAKRIAKELPKGERGLMPAIWMTISFMDQPDRIKIAKAYAKGKSKAQVDSFLKKGNLMGVFTYQEMEKVRKRKFNNEDRDKFAIAWTLQNDFKEQERRLLTESYGTRRVTEAMGMEGMGYWLRVVAKGAFAATGIANYLVQIFKGGGIKGILKDPTKAVKALATPHVLYGIGGYAAVKVYESEKRLGQHLEGKEDKVPRAHQKALLALKKKISGRKEKGENKDWLKWYSFFSKDNFNASKLFNDYVVQMKALNGGDLAKARDSLSVNIFDEHLGLQEKSRKDGKKIKRKDANFGSIRKSLAGVNASDFYEYAKIFDLMSEGGIAVGGDTKKVFKKAIKDSKLA